MRKRAQGPRVMTTRRSCWVGEVLSVRVFGWGRWAYEEAADPFFNNGQVGGEDGEPGHNGQDGCRLQADGCSRDVAGVRAWFS